MTDSSSSPPNAPMLSITPAPSDEEPAPLPAPSPASAPVESEAEPSAGGVVFEEGTAATIEGSLEAIVFRNEREGFTVADFLLDDGRRVKVVGELAQAQLGAPLMLSGAFERDPRFGLQFCIEGVLDPQASEEVAQAYLASGLIPYVGAAGAAEIVAASGADTLRILATNPDSLTDYRGITATRLPRIRRALRETLPLAPIVGLLNFATSSARASGHDARKLPIKVAKRIHRHYGVRAAEIIRANPWRLAKEIAGVGFLSADNIAIGLGCPLDSPTRIEAAVLESLRIAAVSADNTDEGGHIYLPGSVLEARTAALSACDHAAAAAAILRLVGTGEIEFIKSHHGYAIPRLADAERLIAAKLRLIAAFADASPIMVSEEEIDEIERNENEALVRFSTLSDTNPTAALDSPARVPVSASDSASPSADGSPRASGATAPEPVLFKFDSSQRRAIRKALEDRITIITGQPGTGKTTLVRAILDLADAHGLSSVLVSPTGRAAKRLSEATGRPAQTIHRFLRYRPDQGFLGPETLPDVCVVDEVSMLDSILASHLIGVLPPFVRLILVGDEDQLPAVGPGNVLGDLLGAPTVNVLRLQTIHRTARGSNIPGLAYQIRIGVRQPDFDGRSTRFVHRGEDAKMKPAEQGAQIADWIGKTVSQYRDRIDEFQILCPMKKGACGTEALNRLVQGIVNPGPHTRSLRREGFTLYPGDRVIVTQNDYENGLFNGDVGRLLDITEEGKLVVNFDGIERTLPPDAGGGMLLSYAITTHKCVSITERVPVIGRGLIRIDEVKVGDLTPHGEIQGLWPTTKKEVVIRTRQGYEVSCSAEHRWMTARDLVATSDLVIGDRIEIANIPSFPGNNEIDPEFAWFIGYLIGDGNSTNESEGQLHLSCMTPFLGERYRDYLTSRGLHSAWRKDGRGIHSISKPFRQELERLGLGYEKGPAKKVPHAIWESGPLAWASFLQGLFDADGSISVKNPIRLATSSRQMAQEVQLMLLAMGIRSTRSAYRPGGGNPYWQVHIGAIGIDRYRSLIGFSDPAKKAKLEIRRHNQHIIHHDPYDPIVEIRETGHEIEMMDIEIPSPHLISFSCFVGHNSQGSEFPIVLIPMHTSFYIMLKRRLLYTAVSRARVSVAIVGQAKAVSMAIGNHDPRARRTLLLDYLTAKDAPAAPLVAPEEVPEDELF